MRFKLLLLLMLPLVTSVVVSGTVSGDIKSTSVSGEDWELVHQVEIMLPREKRTFGKVEVLLDKNSIKINGHEVSYVTRVYRKGRTSERETKEFRVSDCQAGRYRIERAINLRSGKVIDVKNRQWRKPRQAHVLKLERHICEKVCGIGYPDRGKPRVASCLARPRQPK